MTADLEKEFNLYIAIFEVIKVAGKDEV